MIRRVGGATAIVTALIWTLVVFAAEAGHGGPHAHYRIGRHGWKLPDPFYTVGVPAQPLPTREDLCTKGPDGKTYAQRTRLVPSRIANLIYEAYEVGREPGICCEVDHLCALAHGCTNRDPDEPDATLSYLRELWPQPWAEAREKDKLERKLWRMICAREITPAEAIKAITADWTEAYDKYVLGRKEP